MLPYFVLHTSVATASHHRNTLRQGHTTAAMATKTTTTTTIQAKTFRNNKRKGLWVNILARGFRCLNDEFTKKICNDCHVASPGLVSRKGHLSRSAKAGNTHTHTLARELHTRPTSDSEGLGGGGAAHSNTAEQTPPGHRNVSTGSGRCGFLSQTSQTGNRKDYFYCDTLQLTAHY